MKIATDRLTLKLLSPEEAELFFLGNNLLEQHLCLPDANRIIDAHFKEVAESILLPNLKKDKENAFFYSFFILIENASQQIAGEIGCHSKPDETGKVEIGYSTQAAFRNKGFMSEAVVAFTRFLLSLENVKTIIAVTDTINIPSQNVLFNNNFVKDKADTETIIWKLNKIS